MTGTVEQDIETLLFCSMCVRSETGRQAGWGEEREERGGVYPSTQPVVVTNRTPAASHYFTAAVLSLSAQ